MRRFTKGLFLLLSLVLLFGTVSCHVLDTILDGDGSQQELTGQNPLLKLPPLPEDAVVVDIYKIRVPYSKRDLVHKLWERTDSRDIPVELCNELYRKGIRVGTLGSNIPVELSRLLELKDMPVSSPTAEKLYDVSQELKSPSLTTRNSTVIRQGVPASIETCTPLERLSLFEVVNGERLGKTYYKAFGMIQLGCEEQVDGSVRMTVVPEIHYGDIITRPAVKDSVVFMEKARRKLTLDHLTIRTDLLLGQWLIIGPTGESSGFGNRIFVQDMGDPEQKLLAVRLVRTRHDGIHDRKDIATLDWVSQEKEKENGDDSDSGQDEPLSPNVIEELSRRKPAGRDMTVKNEPQD
ncbi:MAG: hypothetical protein LBQ54_02680 [Planctomycetaceae bacterium]|nr:hypothetical protein [Planctomycetaceae bacterium]